MVHSKQLLQGEHIHYSQSLLNLANHIFSPGFVSAIGVDHLPPPTAVFVHHMEHTGFSFLAVEDPAQTFLQVVQTKNGRG